MRNLTLTTAFLCWISISLSECQNVVVQSGEEVTLSCSNLYTYKTLTFWFRLINRTKVSCISVLLQDNDVSYCEGFQDGKVEMSSNSSTLFLKIKQVDLSDAGLYFCGFYLNARPIFSVIDLDIKGGDDFDEDVDKQADETAKLINMILGFLILVLVMVIASLVVKIRKLQKGEKEERNPQQSEILGSEDLNYATVAFGPKARRRESNVVYAAPNSKHLEPQLRVGS